MRRRSKSGGVNSAIAILVLLGVAVGAAKFLYDRRTTVPWYHLALLKIRGDVALKGATFVPEDLVRFSHGAKDTLHPLWAFRPAHVLEANPIPVVDDTDHDGVPEVYIGSYSKKLYALDGRDGTSLWDWELPFGVIGARSVVLRDVDRDGRRDVVVGSNTSLPIRVYALDTRRDRASDERAKWIRDLSGDFIEGGLNAVRHDSQEFVVVATRDAPYSRGTLNVLTAAGTPLFPPIFGIDNCLSRPAIGELPGIPGLAVVHGSHKFYGATFGHQIAARALSTGAVAWATELPGGGDTGFQNHQIVDVDFDGANEVVAFSSDQDPETHARAFVLDGRTGRIERELPGGGGVSILEESRLVLFDYPRAAMTAAYDEHGELRYILPGTLLSQVRTERGAPARLVKIVLERDQIRADVYDSTSGVLVQESAGSVGELAADESLLLDGPEQQMEVLTWADSDNDGYWNAFIQIRDFVVDLHVPLTVEPGSRPYAPMPFRNSDNSGMAVD